MKINIGSNDITETTRLNSLDIPLAYLDTHDTTYEARFRIEDGFASESSVRVQPYQQVGSPWAILFDEEGKPVKDISLKRQGNTYIYEPKNVISFSPETFTVSAELKRAMTYQDSEQYNIHVGTLEKNSALTFSNKLISAFGDAYKRKDSGAPANVRINGGSVLPQTLIGESAEADFIFLQSDDGVNLSGLDLSAVMEKHINLWLSVKSFGDMLVNYTHKETDSAPTAGGVLGDYRHWKKERAVKDISSKVFDTSQDRPSIYQQDGWIVRQHPYEDVLILEKSGQGYVIVTPSDFLEKNIGANVNLIYDILLYCFCGGYMTSKTASSWITDNPVDLWAYSCQPCNLYHKPINLNDLLASDDYNLGSSYILQNIVTDNANVVFVGMDSRGNMSFRKSGRTKDPEKPAGSTSFLTTDHTVLYYQEDNVYLKTGRLSLNSISVNGGVAVKIDPYADSVHAVYTDKAQTLIIPDVSRKYYLCTRRGNADFTNVFELVDSDAYSMLHNGYKLAEVSVVSHYNVQMTDIRTRGGGLPSGEPDDYNLIDIGNAYGRPYRLGGTLIVRLPKRLQKYSDRIEQAVKAHIGAGTYPVLVFE